MSRKLYTLISGLVGAVEAAAVALVTYFDPVMATAINASVVIAGTAIIEICGQFVKE